MSEELAPTAFVYFDRSSDRLCDRTVIERSVGVGRHWLWVMRTAYKFTVRFSNCEVKRKMKND
jgi:hypothetical protein